MVWSKSCFFLNPEQKLKQQSRLTYTLAYRLIYDKSKKDLEMIAQLRLTPDRNVSNLGIFIILLFCLSVLFMVPSQLMIPFIKYPWREIRQTQIKLLLVKNWIFSSLRQKVFLFHIVSVALFAELIIYKLSARARYLKSKSIIIILRHLNIYGGLKEIFMELSGQVRPRALCFKSSSIKPHKLSDKSHSRLWMQKSASVCRYQIRL